MFKKFKDKLFSNSKQDADGRPDRGSFDHKDIDDLRLPSYKKGSVTMLKRNGDDAIAVGVTPAHSKSSAFPGSFTQKIGALPTAVNGNTGSNIVPTVQVNKAAGPGQLTSTPGSSRRKSTPAALDMALRTAEGKAAIEQLLNNQQVQKPMAFAQYFGSSVTSPRSEMPSPGVLSPTGVEAPRAPLAVRLAGKSAAPRTYEAETSKASKVFESVPGDVDMDKIAAAKQQASRASRPPADSATDSRPASASVHSAAALVPSSSSNVGRRATDEDANSPGRRNKVLAMSPNLHAAMARKYWALADYSIIRKMYTGYASTVYQATCKKSAEPVALKVYHMENLCELNHYQVYREIRVHATLQHQNIIHMFAAFQEGTDVVLVQEYAEGGDLYRLLHRNGGRLSERQAVEMVLHPFLLALHYLHTRGIMHRDVKPENVLFTEQRVLKLADFGLAIDLNEERAVTRAGTLDYMAPEVLRCPPKNLPQENKNNAYLHYNNSVDAWAVGVFAYELVVGFPPFAGETQLDSVDKIMHSMPEFPEKMTELAKSFICQALKKHPGDRPTVMEMLHHPWIRSYQRRTSMLHMPASKGRRGSTAAYMEASYAVGQRPLPAAQQQVPAPAPAPAAAAAAAASPRSTTSSAAQQPAVPVQVLQGLSSNDLADVSPEDLSPEQIEEMIRRLMVAKQAAMERAASGAGNGSNSNSGSLRVPSGLLGQQQHGSSTPRAQ